MDTWSVTWTVLPNGFGADGRARLSLVPTLKVSADTGELGDTPVSGWPTLVAGLDRIRLEVRESGSGGGRPAAVPASIVSAEPDQELWNRLFAPGTPVDTEPVEPDIDQLSHAETAVSYGPTLEAVRALYDGVAAASADGVLPPDHQAFAAVRGLAAWTTTTAGARLGRRAARGLVGTHADDLVAELLSPGALTADRVGEAAEMLRAHGDSEAAAALPLALVQQRLRYSGGSRTARLGPDGKEASIGNPPPPKPSLVRGIRPVQEADFEQVVGLLGSHPRLATALGLRVDIEVANGTQVFAGDRFVRLLASDTPPLQGPTTVRQPWSAVRGEPSVRRFVMRPDPTADPKATEVRNGMLDLAPRPTSRYLISTSDVYAAAQNLQALSGVLTSADPPPAVGLPPRRNAGIVVVQVDRRTGVFENVLTRAKVLRSALVSRSDDVVLFADDVTSGYRVDVSADGGPFRSLMRRTIAYRLGLGPSRAPSEVEATDEGAVEPITLAEQYDVDEPHLLIGEELFGWDGGSLVAAPPGRRLAGEPGRPAVEDTPPPVAPGYPLTMRVGAQPGTLPRLRFGRDYRLRVRTVDPAGNSLPADGPDAVAIDPALVSGPVPYHRLDPVLAPTVVPRRAFDLGESRDRLVVRSNGEGQVIGGPCERHLFPPKATQRLAETHGMFDAAFGPTATAVERQRQFAIASSESGHLTDVLVRDPADPTKLVKQPGARVVVNIGAAGPPTSTLPLARGAMLPAGEYMVVDSTEPQLPWLADPATSGAAVHGLPGQAGAVVVAPYGSRGSWPDVRPARLLAAAGAAGSTKLSSVGPDKRGLVELTVPPATETRLQLSSALRKDLLDCFDLPTDRVRQHAADGLIGTLSPRDDLVVVHAVSKPMLPLKLRNVTATVRQLGDTTFGVSGQLTCHPASTARVDVEATWQEPVDDGTSDFRLEPRSVTGQPVDIEPATADLHWSSRLAFGDPRRRDLTIRPIASSRFREYFRTDQLQTRTGEGGTVIVLNCARPAPPRVHSVLPTFRWTRQMLPDGSYHSLRETAGVRIWLQRPWMETGIGEQLGVVLFSSKTAGATAIAAGLRGADLATRYFSDPLAADSGSASSALDGTSVSNPAQAVRGFALHEAVSGSDNVHVAGVEVRFDAERKLWFADVDFSAQVPRGTFLRIGLVRYQPESVTGCHISRVVVTELVQLPRFRSMVVAARPDKKSVRVSISGPHAPEPNFRYRTEVVRRLGGGSPLSVVQDLRTPVTFGNVLPPGGANDSGVQAVGDQTVPDDLTGFDLVVCEEWMGDYLHADRLQPRTTWFDLVPGERLAQLLGRGPVTRV